VRKLLPALKRREPGQYLDEDLLRRILSILGMVEHADRNIVNPSLMTLDQILERFEVARAGAHHKISVFMVGG
jgi:hypothetical protein